MRQRLGILAACAAVVALAGTAWLATKVIRLEDRVGLLEKPPSIVEPSRPQPDVAGDREVAAARTHMKRLGQAVDSFYLDNRALPASLNELTVEGHLPSVPLDPWDGAYEYRILNAWKKEYVLTSAGADRTIGSNDDIEWNSKQGFLD